MKTTFLTWLGLAALTVTNGFGQNREASTLATIVNADSPVHTRLEAGHSLGTDLKAGELRAFCRFIKALPDTREQNPAALQLVKNDLLNALMQQTVPPMELTGTMIEAYQNPGQDPVTRDYVLQHLVTWYEQGAAGSSNAKQTIREVLGKAVQEDNSSAGTALLGMHRLAAGDPAFKHEQIKKYSLAMANGNHPMTIRITAIQVCAEEGAMEALPLIRSLALADTPMALRISAIGALGQLGGEQDIAALQQMERGSDLSLRPAIESALWRLQHEFHLQKVALNLN